MNVKRKIPRANVGNDNTKTRLWRLANSSMISCGEFLARFSLRKCLQVVATTCTWMNERPFLPQNLNVIHCEGPAERASPSITRKEPNSSTGSTRLTGPTKSGCWRKEVELRQKLSAHALTDLYGLDLSSPPSTNAQVIRKVRLSRSDAESEVHKQFFLSTLNSFTAKVHLFPS